MSLPLGEDLFPCKLTVNGQVRAEFKSAKEAMLLMITIPEEFYGSELMLEDKKNNKNYKYYDFEYWAECK